MLTLQGMVAQAIHEDRIRAYESPARLHSITAPDTTRRTVRMRALVGRAIASLDRRTSHPTTAPNPS